VQLAELATHPAATPTKSAPHALQIPANESQPDPVYRDIGRDSLKIGWWQ